jgi:hypothetical protein
MIPSYRTIILTRRSKEFRLAKSRLSKYCGIITLKLVVKLITQKLSCVLPLPV